MTWCMNFVRVITLSLSLHLGAITHHTRLKYYYDQGDYNGMKAKLDHTDWGEILGTSIINHQWLGFKEYIKKIEDECIPHRLV